MWIMEQCSNFFTGYWYLGFNLNVPASEKGNLCCQIPCVFLYFIWTDQMVQKQWQTPKEDILILTLPKPSTLFSCFPHSLPIIKSKPSECGVCHALTVDQTSFQAVSPLSWPRSRSERWQETKFCFIIMPSSRVQSFTPASSTDTNKGHKTVNWGISRKCTGPSPQPTRSQNCQAIPTSAFHIHQPHTFVDTDCCQRLYIWNKFTITCCFKTYFRKLTDPSPTEGCFQWQNGTKIHSIWWN